MSAMVNNNLDPKYKFQIEYINSIGEEICLWTDYIGFQNFMAETICWNHKEVTARKFEKINENRSVMKQEIRFVKEYNDDPDQQIWVEKR
jgi:hypothetical protein